MAHENAGRITEAVVRAGVWELGSYSFASGKTANNKFVMERIMDDAAAKELFFGALEQNVARHKPDALWGVPTGGQDFAIELGGRLGLEVIRLRKKPGAPKEIEYATPDDEALATYYKQMVGVEDLTNEMTSFNRAVRVGDLATRTVALEAGWRRGTAEIEQDIRLPIDWVVEEAVPNTITNEHPFFVHFGLFAVRYAECDSD